MTFTYTFANAKDTVLKREDEQGNIVWIPTDPANTDYAKFLSSGAEAEPYVAPPEPEPLTAEEKLAKAGLTVDELKELLGL